MEISEQRQGDIIILIPVGRINNDTSTVFQPKAARKCGLRWKQSSNRLFECRVHFERWFARADDGSKAIEGYQRSFRSRSAYTYGQRNFHD